MPASTAPSPRSTTRFKWIAALGSIAVALLAGEGLVRWALFDAPFAVGAREPAWYARDADELWVYRHLFSRGGGRSAAPDRPDSASDSRIPFYRDWATSLMPDAELGWVRKPDVRVPCHETTALATRGTHDYPPAGRRILFFGDSFVESAACSNDTLPAKIERRTGVDTLDYGIGGYGLDQIALYLERVAPTCDRDDCLFLVGLIPNDLERVLLKVRTAAKPYFTIDGDRLVVHADHLHPATPDDAFARPPARSYLWDFVRGRLGHPVYAAYLARTEDARREAEEALSRKLVERLAALAEHRRFRLAFVLLPQPGVAFDRSFVDALVSAGMPTMDVQGCLRASRRPDADLYVELHPTSLGNDLLAACIVDGLTRLRWLP